MNYAPPIQPGQPPSNATPVYELSGWWARAGALIIDGILVGIASVVIGVILGISLFGPEGAFDPDRESSDVDLISGLLTLAVGAVYYCVIMARTNGQTVGKQATGIRVVREDGEEMDVKFAFVRQTLVIALLFNFLSAFALFVPTILNYLFPIWDDKNQALHDKMVKSRVVKAHPVMYQQYGPPVGYGTPATPYVPPPTQPYAPPPQPYAPPPGPPAPPVPPAPQPPPPAQPPAPQPPQFPQAPPAQPAPQQPPPAQPPVAPPPQQPVQPPAPPRPAAPPPPPAPPPAGQPQPYSPPPGFVNPVPDDD